MSRTYRMKRSAPSGPNLGIEYEAELNAQQLEVVQAPDGPLLVIAGAGTGKTRTLTYRVAQLVERGVAPGEIMMLTFTNRAAHEMVSRIEALTAMDARQIWGGTFHSVGRRLLRECADRIGYPANFGILDREDCESLMRQVASDGKRPKGERFPRPAALLRVLDETNRSGAPVAEVLSRSYPAFAHLADEIQATLIGYQSRKFECGVMDFDDLLSQWRRVMLEFDDVRARFSSRFRHVLVDEFQDTNGVQSDIVDQLCSTHGNIMVVGDDAQSIYSFRGARVANILEFPERYPGCRTYRLETNYRSTPQILALSNRSIAKNESAFEKSLVAVRHPGPPPAVVTCADDKEQAEFIAQRILDLREEDVSLDQIAVLYRAHWHSVELQVALGSANIPFRVHSGMRFFEQRHIKDVMAFLRFAENPRDELSFQRVAMLAKGIGAVTAGKLFRELQTAGDAIAGLADLSLATRVPRGAQEAWPLLREALSKTCSEYHAARPAEAIDHITETFYEQFAQTAYDNPSHRLRELETLSTYASQQASRGDLLASLALAGAGAGVDRFANEDEDDEAVVLSTIHQSKGLEFHAVFVLNLVEDRFPSARGMTTPEDLEEERRLFYVACTRAEQELYLTTPMRSFDRREGLVFHRQSLFIEELKGSPPVYETWRLQ